MSDLPLGSPMRAAAEARRRQALIRARRAELCNQASSDVRRRRAGRGRRSARRVTRALDALLVRSALLWIWVRTRRPSVQVVLWTLLYPLLLAAWIVKGAADPDRSSVRRLPFVALLIGLPLLGVAAAMGAINPAAVVSGVLVGGDRWTTERFGFPLASFPGLPVFAFTVIGLVVRAILRSPFRVRVR